MWDTLGVGRNAAAAFQATDRRADKQTDGHHHRMKPALLRRGLNKSVKNF